jgi:hypothetical protein
LEGGALTDDPAKLEPFTAPEGACDKVARFLLPRFATKTLTRSPPFVVGKLVDVVARGVADTCPFVRLGEGGGVICVGERVETWEKPSGTGGGVNPNLVRYCCWTV